MPEMRKPSGDVRTPADLQNMWLLDASRNCENGFITETLRKHHVARVIHKDVGITIT